MIFSSFEHYSEDILLAKAPNWNDSPEQSINEKINGIWVIVCVETNDEEFFDMYLSDITDSASLK